MSDLKKQIIEQLNLQDVKPEDIGDDQPLFNEGLGLDSKTFGSKTNSTSLKRSLK